MAGKGSKPAVSNAKEQIVKTKMVNSTVCEACKEKCPQGIKYIEKMSKPGATGRGVSCSKVR